MAKQVPESARRYFFFEIKELSRAERVQLVDLLIELGFLDPQSRERAVDRYSQHVEVADVRDPRSCPVDLYQHDLHGAAPLIWYTRSDQQLQFKKCTVQDFRDMLYNKG